MGGEIVTVREKPCVLFVSWHFYLDHSNGASISARELLLALSKRGWNIKSFCGPCIDNPATSNIENILNFFNIPRKIILQDKGVEPFTVFSFEDSGIFSVVFSPEDSSSVPLPLVGELFLTLLDDAISRIKPDIVITYGGYWLVPKIMKTIQHHGARSVFLLQNFAYDDRDIFKTCDLTIVPSCFAAKVYRKRLEIETTVIPPLIRRENVVFCEESETECKKFVLFINPSHNKGVRLFLKIAHDMQKRRPDVLFLVVESCSTSDEFLSGNSFLNGMTNISTVSPVMNPRDLYRHAKITLVPSLFDESFGRVAAESMMAGVPVVATDRGALPETIGSGGTLIHVPEKYTPRSTSFPTSDEIEPWLEEIIKLWDSKEYFNRRRNDGLKRAQRWDYSTIVDQYETVLRSL